MELKKIVSFDYASLYPTIIDTLSSKILRNKIRKGKIKKILES